MFWDIAGYKTTCGRMLERFGELPNPDSGYWVALTYVLASDAVADFTVPLQHAEKALARDPKNSDDLNTLGPVL